MTRKGATPFNFFEIGQCQDDQFSVTAPGNNAPPVICGTNSGEHSKLVTCMRSKKGDI